MTKYKNEYYKNTKINSYLGKILQHKINIYILCEIDNLEINLLSKTVF